MELTREQIDALKAKHPGRKLVQLDADGVDTAIVVRKPDAFDYQKWADRKSDPDQRTKAGRQLFFDCIVYPDGPQVAALVDSFPALPDNLASELLVMAGAAMKVEKKEL